MRNKFAVASFSILSLTLFSFSFFKIEINIKPGGPAVASAEEPRRLMPTAPATSQATKGNSTPPAAPYPDHIEVTNPVTVKRIKFARGGTSSVVTGSIGRVSEHDFLLGARSDQFMSVSLSADGALYCVYAPDGSPLSEMSSAEWSGVLHQSGDYRIKVFANGRNGKYRLDVSIQ